MACANAQPQRFVLVKPRLLSSHSSHFAGGKHAFLCMAATLASRGGHEVHVVCISSKAALMVASLQGAPMVPSLTAMSWQADAGDAATSHQIVTWQQQSIHFHAVLRDEGDGAPGEPGARARDVHAAVAARVAQLAAQQEAWLVVDADDCQVQDGTPSTAAAQGVVPGAEAVRCASCSHAAGAAAASATATGHRGDASLSREARSLFEHLVGAVPPSRAVALVQNVHFLPCGPYGTSKRTPGLLKAWSGLGGVLCVSRFVHDYVEQHLPASLQQHLGAADQGGSTSRVPPLHVTRLNAWGCFGQGPFPDCSQEAAKHVDGWRSLPQNGSSGNAPSAGQAEHPPSPPIPVVGCLKLTPEKGCSVVHALARALEGRCRFLLVSGDPAVQELFQGMKHVKVVPPQPGVDELLRRVCVVLAPSLWLEAWGMVVTDSLLRGVPVITSDTGALPEAGLGCCPRVHVEPIEVPVCCCCATPTWAARRYPLQEVQPWLAALEGLLGDRDAFLSTATSCREAALRFVEQERDGELDGFVAWLQRLTPHAS